MSCAIKTTVTAFKCAYYGYKIFQAARMCMGDITVLGELLVGGVTEAAAESLCDYVAETVLEEAVEHVISLAINATKVKNNMSDFKKFAEQLGEELNRNHSRKGQEMMNEAQRVFTTFSECDTDGNGVISREEFIHFCAVYGVSRREALRLFEEADRDQNGEISFSEWLDVHNA